MPVQSRDSRMAQYQFLYLSQWLVFDYQLLHAKQILYIPVVMVGRPTMFDKQKIQPYIQVFFAFKTCRLLSANTCSLMYCCHPYLFQS
jgi:hypothetical protein